MLLNRGRKYVGICTELVFRTTMCDQWPTLYYEDIRYYNSNVLNKRFRDDVLFAHQQPACWLSDFMSGQFYDGFPKK